MRCVLGGDSGKRASIRVYFTRAGGGAAGFRRSVQRLMRVNGPEALINDKITMIATALETLRHRQAATVRYIVPARRPVAPTTEGASAPSPAGAQPLPAAVAELVDLLWGGAPVATGKAA